MFQACGRLIADLIKVCVCVCVCVEAVRGVKRVLLSFSSAVSCTADACLPSRLCGALGAAFIWMKCTQMLKPQRKQNPGWRSRGGPVREVRCASLQPLQFKLEHRRFLSQTSCFTAAHIHTWERLQVTELLLWTTCGLNALLKGHLREAAVTEEDSFTQPMLASMKSRTVLKLMHYFLHKKFVAWPSLPEVCSNFQDLLDFSVCPWLLTN